MANQSGLIRIAIFYDGNYFWNVSDYYTNAHSRKARISLEGLHGYIQDKVRETTNNVARSYPIVSVHYFRGRMSTPDAHAQDPTHRNIYAERQFEDVLISGNVDIHYTRLSQPVPGGPWTEKGIDVWLASKAVEMASKDLLDVAVLITGDGDFVPLVHQIQELGKEVMVVAWRCPAATYIANWGPAQTPEIRASQPLLDIASHSALVNELIDSTDPGMKKKAGSLFLPSKTDK